MVEQWQKQRPVSAKRERERAMNMKIDKRRGFHQKEACTIRSLLVDVLGLIKNLGLFRKLLFMDWLGIFLHIWLLGYKFNCNQLFHLVCVIGLDSHVKYLKYSHFFYNLEVKFKGTWEISTPNSNLGAIFFNYQFIWLDCGPPISIGSQSNVHWTRFN